MKAIRDNSGFTLLELLVSLSLLGLIMTYMFFSLSFGKRAWETTDDVDRMARIEAARSFLIRRLSQAIPLNAFDAATRQPRFAFEGGPDRIRFVAATQGRTEIAGLYRYDIALLDMEGAGDGPGTVTTSQTLFRMSRAVAFETNSDERPLIEDVASLRFSYYGVRRRGAPPDWHDTWTGTDTLPRLVRLSLEFASPGQRPWVDLVVPLKLVRQ